MAVGRKREDRQSDKAAAADKPKRVLKKDGRDARKEAAKKKGPGFIATTKDFLEGVVRELKKVHWPGRREVVIYTAVVFVAVVLVGAILWIFDLILSQILVRILT